MRISDWSSDVCSSDLLVPLHGVQAASAVLAWGFQFHGSRSSICRIGCVAMRASASASQAWGSTSFSLAVAIRLYMTAARWPPRSEPQNSQDFRPNRSEEHTSELQSLMRTSYAVLCLKK